MSVSKQVSAAAVALLTSFGGAAFAADGAAAFGDAKCSLCHAVAAAGIEARNKSPKNAAPDMSGYRPRMEFAELAAYLRKQTKSGGGEHKLPFKGSDEELQAIIDWLGSLEATQ